MHSPDEIADRLSNGATVLPDAIEDALVRIVNSATHEAAIEIATAFLMGE